MAVSQPKLLFFFRTLSAKRFKSYKMKSNFLSRFWLGILSLFLILFLIWGIFYVQKLELKIQVFGIVGLIIAAFTSVLTVNLNNNKIKEREIQLMLLKERQGAFMHFYNSYFEMLNQIKSTKPNQPSAKAYKEMMEFKKGLMYWGSENLISKYIEYDNSIITDGGKHFELIKSGNTFLLELRKELGFEDSGKVNIMSVILDSKARQKLDK